MGAFVPNQILISNIEININIGLKKFLNQMKENIMRKLFTTLVFILFFVIQFTFKADDCNAQWTQVNYNFYGKSVNASIVLGDTVFVGTGGQGVYYSINNGVNWIQTSLNSVDVRAFLMSGNILYAGTTGGMYSTTNRGVNWTQIFTLGTGAIAIENNTIYAGTTGSGVYISTNNGANWIATALTGRDVLSIVKMGINLFAGIASEGIFLSTNNGISWSQIPVNGTNNYRYTYTLKVYNGSLYAGERDYNYGSSGLYRTTNNGVNWTRLLSINNWNYGTTSVEFSGDTIYAGINGWGVYISTNNGTSWVQTILDNKSVSSLTKSGVKIFAGTSGSGLYTSTNNCSSWETPPPSNVGVIKQTGNNLYAGGTEGVYHSSDGGLKWIYKNKNLNTYSLLIDGINIYAGTAGSGVYLTTNDGTNWVQQTSLPNLVVNSLAKKDSCILAATTTNGVYYSTNNGTNWIQSGLNGITAKALYVLDSLVYAGTIFGGVYKSSNNGVNWIQTSLMFLDVNSFIAEGNKLYAGTTSSGIYYTTNQGANWTQTSMTTNSFFSFSTYGSTVFGGTNNIGVYMTKNAGINWTQTNDGMSNQNVRALHTYGNYVIAGTGGNGFWRRYILEFAPIRGDANLDSTVNVLDVTSDVNYILGNPPVPFSVLAADVNNDLVVNVLDVVGTVNIILHPTFRAFANNEQNDNRGSANLYIQNNNLKLQNTVPVAGIQYKLSGAGAQNVVFTPSSELTNYQVAAGSASENSKTFVVFTMSDSSINSGIHTLGTFTGLNNGIVMNQVYIADGNGNGVITSNEENENTEIPKEYTLNQNYPNPFNSTSKLKFEIANLGYTKIVIYDVMGRELQTLVNKTLKPGKYDISIDGSNLSSGVYFYKLTSGSYSATKKMIVLK